MPPSATRLLSFYNQPFHKEPLCGYV